MIFQQCIILVLHLFQMFFTAEAVLEGTGGGIGSLTEFASELLTMHFSCSSAVRPQSSSAIVIELKQEIHIILRDILRYDKASLNLYIN